MTRRASCGRARSAQTKLAGGLDAREGALVFFFEVPLARHRDADAGDADAAVDAAKELRTAQRAVVLKPQRDAVRVRDLASRRSYRGARPCVRWPKDTTWT